MSYLTVFLFGIIIGLIFNIFFPGYISKGKELMKDESLATKEDIKKITKDLEELKYLQKYNEDNNNEIVEAENEFYESISGE